MPTLAETVTALNANIDAALTKINNDIAAVQNGKLDVANNFDNTGTGLTATTLAGAIVELKQSVADLEAVAGTDAEITQRLNETVGLLTNLDTAAKTDAVTAINELHAEINTNTAAIANKLNSSAYTAADVLAKLLTVDTNASGLNATTLQGKGPADFVPAANVQTPVPLNAKFTDTVYVHPATHSIAEVSGLQTLLNTFATTADLTAAISATVDAAPNTLNTLNELAAALGDDPNFATTIAGQIGGKLDASAYTAADVLAKLLTVDGGTSGLDAQFLAGKAASHFATASDLSTGLSDKVTETELENAFANLSATFASYA